MACFKVCDFQKFKLLIRIPPNQAGYEQLKIK